MTRSQNGYPAGDSSLLGTYTVPGTHVRLTLRRGDVSVVLLEAARRWNLAESLQRGQCGGYAYRPVRGGSGRTMSNHASGSAIDLNWQLHPQGSRHTVSGHLRLTIDGLLRDFPSLRWGGNYRSAKPDEMHLEVYRPELVHADAEKVRRGQPPAARTGVRAPDRHLGLANPAMQGQDVVNVQHALAALGHAAGRATVGTYDTPTAQAVHAWQAAAGIDERGVGPKTWAALREHLRRTA